MQYNVKNDGKLHTRFTDLMRATPAQVENIIKEQTGEKERFKSDVMDFGTVRHDMFDKESKQTGMLPVVFREAFPEYKDMQITHAEKEFATEIFKGIVVHSRPDGVSVPDATVVDYKTQIEGAGGARKYGSSKQLPFYAFQLGWHNIRIKRYVYLIEIWNKETETEEAYTRIVGYDKFEKTIGLVDIAAIKSWVHGRCEVLAMGMKMAGLWK
jgi:hypothetical protein